MYFDIIYFIIFMKNYVKTSNFRVKNMCLYIIK